MPNHIYCKNKKCEFYKFLDEPISFKFTKIYSPFEGDKCYGECSLRGYFTWFNEEKNGFRYEGSSCDVDKDENINASEQDNYTYCSQSNCAHWKSFMIDGSDAYGGECGREEILVDKERDEWACKCFSLSKIRGHWDWFGRFCNPDGSAKGGHIDDEYAKKMDKWKKTTRSYKTHMKQVS